MWFEESFNKMLRFTCCRPMLLVNIEQMCTWNFLGFTEVFEMCPDLAMYSSYHACTQFIYTKCTTFIMHIYVHILMGHVNFVWDTLFYHPKCPGTPFHWYPWRTLHGSWSLINYIPHPATRYSHYQSHLAMVKCVKSALRIIQHNLSHI